MIGTSFGAFVESVGEFFSQRPVGRALAWLVPALLAVAAVLCGLWWGMRR